MFTVTATATVKTTNKIRRLFHVKKRRLPRKMKKALRGVATLTPHGKWRLSSDGLSNVKIKTKWQRKAYRKYAYRIMDASYDEILDCCADFWKEADKVINAWEKAMRELNNKNE